MTQQEKIFQHPQNDRPKIAKDTLALCMHLQYIPGLVHCWESCITAAPSSDLSVVVSPSDDNELQLLQRRLRFPRQGAPLELDVRGCRVVYSGELSYVDGWRWVDAWVVLLSDALIVTEPGAADSLIVVTEPVSLTHITSAQFDCIHRECLHDCLVQQKDRCNDQFRIFPRRPRANVSLFTKPTKTSILSTCFYTRQQSRMHSENLSLFSQLSSSC